MMVRVLIAAIVARSSNAFLQSATRTARRGLAARALPPHLETVKADVASGDALLLDVREPHEWAAAHFATATSAPLSALQQGACPKEALDATKRLYLHCAAPRGTQPVRRGRGDDVASTQARPASASTRRRRPSRRSAATTSWRSRRAYWSSTSWGSTTSRSNFIIT